jgi:hypothetical protein
MKIENNWCISNHGGVWFIVKDMKKNQISYGWGNSGTFHKEGARQSRDLNIVDPTILDVLIKDEIFKRYKYEIPYRIIDGNIIELFSGAPMMENGIWVDKITKRTRYEIY